MVRKAWSAGLLLVCSFATFAQSPATLEFSVSARIAVDSNGRAHVLEMGKVSRLSSVPSLTAIGDEIAQRLHERIESWQFVPATEDGTPVASTTSVYVALVGSDDGHGGMAVHIRSASTGGELRDVNLPGLTATVMKAGFLEALVLVDVQYDEAGTVRAASIRESKVRDHGVLVPTWDRDLRKGVLRAAQRWLFVPESVRGRPVKGSGRVPIVLCLEACAEVDPAATGGDETHFAATDPAVSLRTDVAGTAL